MATVADFEEVRVLEHVKTSGLLDGFTDINGQLKAAPKLFVSEIDLSTLQANQRAVLFRTSGNDQLQQTVLTMTEKPFSIFVFGRVGIEDAGIIKGYAQDLESWIRQNPSNLDQCIVDIQSLSFNGPFQDETSRRIYEINLLVKFIKK